MCCPHPTKNRMIEPVGTAAKMRSILLLLMLGEIAAIVIKIRLFGFSSLLGLIAVWIIYVAYATMHFCQTLFISFLGVLDMVIILSNRPDESTAQLDCTLYYCLIGYSIFKILVGFCAYCSFKNAYLKEHGNTDVWGSAGRQNDDYVAAPSEPAEPGFKAFQGKGHSLA